MDAAVIAVAFTQLLSASGPCAVPVTPSSIQYEQRYQEHESRGEVEVYDEWSTEARGERLEIVVVSRSSGGASWYVGTVFLRGSTVLHPPINLHVIEQQVASGTVPIRKQHPACALRREARFDSY